MMSTISAASAITSSWWSDDIATGVTGEGEWESGVTSQALSALAAAHPATDSQLEKFFENIQTAGFNEAVGAGGIPCNWSGTGGSCDLPGSWPFIPAAVKGLSPTQIGPMFGQLKAKLLEIKASKTASALTAAASWYWNNIEKPLTPSSSSGSSAAPSSPPAHYQAPTGMAKFMGKGKPFYKKPVVWTGAGVAALITLLLLTRKR